MRRVLVLLLASAITACSTAQPEARSPRAEARLQQWLGNRVAGPPQSCLPSSSARDMIVIDDNTVLFRVGANRIYRSELAGGCAYLGSGRFALATSQTGTGSLCRGEIAQVRDVQGGFTVGSCTFGDFVPYERRGG